MKRYVVQAWREETTHTEELSVLERSTFDGIRFEDGKMYLLDIPVRYYEDYALPEGLIPNLLVVRVMEDGWAQFWGGFDLLENGQVWVRGITLASVRDAIRYLKEVISDEFILELEEPFYESENRRP